MKPQINRKRFLIVAGLVLVLLAAGAVYALAQTDGVINACVLKDGTLRIVADPAECKKNETLYTWNITGPKGDPGLACWDLNGNGVADPEEDANADAVVDALDCKGPQGETGAAGTDGTNGTNGANGLACWDLNGNGMADSEEDANADAVVDALDCKGPKGDAGDTANVDALQAQVADLEAEVAGLHDQVDYVYSLHSNTVFLSSAVYDGAMGGLDGADGKCQALAAAAGLPGTFKAWLSDSTGSPSTRFTHSTLRYVRMDGVKVADDWADLTDWSLDAPINVTENGDQLTEASEASPVTWSNTHMEGEARSSYNHCSNWTANSHTMVYLGRYTAVDAYWTTYGSYGAYCDTTHRIYCFEQ